VDKTNSFVYVGNETSNSISAFTLASTGVLTPIAGSPFVTGTSPYSLAEDSSGTYLLSANAGGTPDLQVFTITPSTGTTPGALTPASSTSTGSVSPAGAISVVTTP
jgi:6-phosphogluconolactonase (cycloisomerase 2 family)